MPKIKANGIKIYYEVHGEGEPLVLILGFIMNHYAWEPIITDLAKKFQVIIFDNRGAGKTEVPDEPYSIELMAKDTFALMDALKIEKASLLGQSMGSAICQEMAHLYPQRIKKMVLCGTFPNGKFTTTYLFHAFGELYQEGLPYYRIMELFFPIVFSYAFLSDSSKLEEVKKLVKKDPYPVTPVGYMRQGDALHQFNSTEYLPHIQIETLVVGYENDICTFTKAAEFVANQIPNAKYALMEGVGHAGIGEQPQAFLEKVLPFLS